MDTKELTKEFNNAVPGAILEARPFGRSHASSFWVEVGSILKLAEFLKSDDRFSMDWLENLSAMEVDGALVLSYFVRSRNGVRPPLILRGSLAPPSAEAEVEAPSVCSVWPMAFAQEDEISQLFGIRFKQISGERRSLGALPSGWLGYPLRKSYLFPPEFMDIPHMRPVGQTGPE